MPSTDPGPTSVTAPIDPAAPDAAAPAVPNPGPTTPDAAAARQPINVTGGLLPVQPVHGKPGIRKVVHHQNFASGGYVVGLSVATHAFEAACPMHNHRGADEQFYVTGGFGIITVDGVPHYVQAGDSVLVPAGAMHMVEAAPRETSEGLISNDPFVVVCVLVVAPGHEDDSTPWVGIATA